MASYPVIRDLEVGNANGIVNEVIIQKEYVCALKLRLRDYSGIFKVSRNYHRYSFFYRQENHQEDVK